MLGELKGAREGITGDPRPTCRHQKFREEGENKNTSLTITTLFVSSKDIHPVNIELSHLVTYPPKTNAINASRK